jgi:hypothetical protein
MNSSRKAGSSGWPPMKPPMSVVHQGMPATPMLRPTHTCLRRVSQSLRISPLHTQRAVTPAACPGAAQEADGKLHAAFPHSFTERPREHLRADIRNAQRGAQPIAAVVVITGSVFGFGFVQPEQADALLAVSWPDANSIRKTWRQMEQSSGCSAVSFKCLHVNFQ